MGDRVREPIQTYLSEEERAELDRAAAELGVSRSEALRRGIRALAGSGAGGPLRPLVAGGTVTPARAGPGGPPPSRPVARLSELMEELAGDRSER